MKRVSISQDVEALLRHECPRLKALLDTTDGRLELERLAYLVIDERVLDNDRAYRRGYAAGYAAWGDGGSP